MADKYQTTKESYDKHVDEYVKNTYHATPPPLQDFIQSLPTGAMVVDLGCGPGRDSSAFIEAGINYLGIDFSEATIEKASELNPNAKFKVGDFRSLKFDPESIDAFWAIAALYHLNKSDFKTVMKRLHGFLKKNGQIFIVMKKGSGEHFSDDKRYASGKKFVSYYSLKELKEIYDGIGFSIKEMFVVEQEKVNELLDNDYENRGVVVAWLIK
jgi:SAM-dependent methyltransferase